MARARLVRLIVALLVALTAPAFLRAAVVPGDMPAEPAAGSSLTGQLLVATPDMDDPRFVHAVILIVRHDQRGALGIMLNRPVEERPLADVLKLLGIEEPDAAGSVRLFAGGPVEPQRGFVVHSADYHRAETVDIDSRLAMTSSPEILRDMAHHHGPAKSLVAFGYAGWGPGQLDNELAQHGWYTAAADPGLVFDEDRGNLWSVAVARRTINL
jgi:putative transcriptional regulator